MDKDILDFINGNDNIIDEILAEVKLYNDKLSVSAEATRDIEQSTKLTENITQDFKFDFENPSAKTTVETGISKKLNDNWTVDTSDSASIEIKADDLITKAEQSITATYDDGILNESLTAASDVEISLKNGLETSNRLSHQISHNGITNTESISGSLGFDGEKATFGTSYDTSSKIGNDNFSVENTANYSSSFGTDGSVNQSTTVGTNVKAGPVEANSSVSVGSNSTENSEETNVEAKAGYAVQTSQGTKLSHETSVKNSEKVTEEEDKTITEEETGVETKTSVEVDYSKASAPEIVAAAAFNATAALTEGILNSAMTSKTEEVEEHGNSEEAEETNKAEAEEEEEEEKEEEAESELEKAERELEEAEKELDEAREEAQQAVDQAAEERAEAERARQEAEQAQQEADEAQAKAEEDEQKAQAEGSTEEDKKAAEESKENASELQSNADNAKDRYEHEQLQADAATDYADEKIQDYGEARENYDEKYAAHQEAQAQEESYQYDYGYGY